MTKDLTKGTPWKVIVKFSLPVIGGNLFQLFYTLADTIIVGRTLGADALAAVGATATIVYFVLCFIQGLTGGFGILLGQAFGAGNERQMKESVSASYWISALFSVLSTAVCCMLVDTILQMLNTPEDIYRRAYIYLFIIFAGNGATVFYNMISNILRALGDSRTPLYFLVFSSLLNVVLDIVFIVPFGWDVAGAAWATVLSQALSAAFCIWYAGKKFEVLHLTGREWRFHAEAVARHLKIGFPMGFQMSVMCIGQLAMQAAVNKIGTGAIAGYTAATKVDQLAVLVDNAVGIGIANYVAQNFGAGKTERIRKGVWHCFLMLTLLNFGMGALLLAGQSYVVPLFVSDPTAEIMAYSRDYLYVIVPFYLFLGALMVYRTAIQSVGNTWAPFAACVIELAARMLCAGVMSVPFGYKAVCFATPFAWVTALVLLIPVYIGIVRKWRKEQEGGKDAEGDIGGCKFKR